jgi:NAD-dependent deacetylase
MNETIKQLANELRQSTKTVILTGAGVSAESGLSTFRDNDSGYWSRFDPMELASVQGFAKHPQRVWRWYQWRRQQVKNARPNVTHYAIARLQQVFNLKLITQNVDGLHQLAGSRQVCELHGSIMQNHCNALLCDYWEEVTDTSTELLLCPQCQSDWLRPSVVWFGESLDPDVLRFAESETYLCDLFLSVGTSSLVYPAAGFAQLAASRGAKVVEINPNATALSQAADFVLAQPATQVFSELMECLGLASNRLEPKR